VPPWDQFLFQRLLLIVLKGFLLELFNVLVGKYLANIRESVAILKKFSVEL